MDNKTPILPPPLLDETGKILIEGYPKLLEIIKINNNYVYPTEDLIQTSLLPPKNLK